MFTKCENVQKCLRLGRVSEEGTLCGLGGTVTFSSPAPRPL